MNPHGGTMILPDDRQLYYDDLLDELITDRKAARKADDAAEVRRLTAVLQKTRDRRGREKQALREARRHRGEAWDQRASKWFMSGVQEDKWTAFVDSELDLLQDDAAQLLLGGLTEERIEAFVSEQASRILRRGKNEADYWFDARQLPWPKALAWLGLVIELVDDLIIGAVIDQLRPELEAKITDLF